MPNKSGHNGETKKKKKTEMAAKKKTEMAAIDTG